MIQPTAYLKVSKFIDVYAKEHWCEPENPQSQEENIVGEHYYEQDEHCIIVFLYLFLHEKHSRK